MSNKGPEWKHVEIQNKTKGGAWVQCIYCQKIFLSGATRIRAHLTGDKPSVGVQKCPQAPDVVKMEMQKIEESKDEIKSKKRRIHAIDQASHNIQQQSSSKQQTIEQPFQKGDKKHVDSCIARFFYANGIPFNNIRSPYFKELVQAIANFGPSYQLQTYNNLRTTSLQVEKERIQKELTGFYDLGKKTGNCIASDGWSSTTNRPLINILAINPKGAAFVRAVDTSGEEKSAAYIAEQIADVIEEIGPNNVNLIITDSAPNGKLAGKQLEQRYENITWMPCTAHVLDLALEDIGKLVPIIQQCKNMVNFVKNHHKSLAIFRKHSNLELKIPGETRFGTVFLMMERCIQVKGFLEKTVVDQEWNVWCEKQKFKSEADEVKKTILCGKFWGKVTNVVKLTEPIFILLKKVDGNVPIMGKVYFACLGIQEHLKQFSIPKNKQKQIIQIWEKRWSMLHSPYHSAGYVLDPEYNTHEQTSISEVVDDYINISEKLLQSDEQVELMKQLSLYKNRAGIFSREMVWKCAPEMQPYSWWEQFGGSTPIVQKIAIKVLSQVSSACSCERNWSDFSFIHSNKRNG